MAASVNFLYEFSDYNPFLALIVPVNESVWEHLKLVFFPVLFLTIAEHSLRRPNPSMLFASRFVGVIFAMAAITVLFYLYTFIAGRSILLLDILIYFTGICLCYIASSNLFPRFRRADPMKIFFLLVPFCTFILLFFRAVLRKSACFCLRNSSKRSFTQGFPQKSTPFNAN